MMPISQIVLGLDNMSSVEQGNFYLPSVFGATPACRSPEDSWSSSTRASTSLEAVDKLLVNPITAKSSLVQLSPDEKVATLENIGIPAQSVAGLPKGCFFHQGGNGEERLQAAGHDTGSYADIMKRGISTNEAEVPGSCDGHLYISPITKANRLGALGGSSSHKEAVGSIALGTTPNTPEIFSETEQLGPLVLLHQSWLGPSNQDGKGDHHDGDPCLCPNLGKLKHDLEMIRKQLDASSLYSVGSGPEQNHPDLPMAPSIGERITQADDSERATTPSLSEQARSMKQSKSRRH
ncbi:hypothetical protein Nepgr_030177 [Nepenthes gracilis]|uniref:Uncharacterized protein n=1 Tax=Nepenthes gracilis TaxID=150966 RepID=A0AAD3Y5U0_NEPGR|nr:hypothetical protein Nepgr_030177 [Nepenthes gracilis]